MKLIFGEEKIARGVMHENDADNVWGSHWRARRTDGGFVLEYDTGSVNGRERSFDISAEEFERLRADPEQFKPIIWAHGG